MPLADEYLNPQLSESDYLFFRELALAYSGLYFPEKKRPSLEAGVLKAFRDYGQAPDLDSYSRLLCQGHNPVEIERLINILTVNETYFFRDEAQFTALRYQILPALIARKRAIAAAIGPEIQPQLRIWCAGCATGEEPYSLAILLKELLPDLASWQLLILGTDINRNSLALAQQASYSEWSFREAQAKAAQPEYFSFDPATRRYCLREDIREMVHFAPLNLARDEFPAIQSNTTNMDLILCRNVTIYFNPETTQRIVNRFYEGLVEEGWLVVGHAEPSQEIYRAFQVHLFPGTLVYQKKQWNQSYRETTEVSETLKTAKVLETLETAEVLEASAVSKAPALERPTGFPDGPEAAARQLLNEGQIEAAIALLRQQAQVTPGAAWLYGLLCRAYANLGAWEEALHWGQQALKLDNLLGEVYYTLALVYEQQQEPELAIAMLKKVIYLEWEAPLPYFYMATLYQKLGRLEEARQAWHKALALLRKWPPEKVVPDSGGETAQNLLRTVQRLLEKTK